MRDKRLVEDLTIEELERVLMIRRREARMERFRGNEDRRVAAVPVPVEPPPAMPQQALPEIAAPAAVESPVTYVGDIVPRPHDNGVPQFEDELPYRDYAPVSGYPPDETAPGWKRVYGGFFLIVEVAAIAALLGLLALAYRGLTTVNRNIERTDEISATSEAELAARRIEPTATPLISVSQVVLPSGHIWDEAGQHRFNLSEVPAPYRATFRQQLEAPRTELPEVPEGGPIRIQIPAINVDAGIRSSDDWISLQAGVGHSPFSSNPGVQGNMVLTAHNDIFGEIFRRTEELNPGDEVRVQSTNGQWYTYVVREKMVVDPSEVWVMDQSLGQQTPIVTLITCYPYRVDTRRMIVFAELVE